MSKYVVLRNIETRNVGILASNVEYYPENRNLSLIVRYFLLDLDMGMQTNHEEDRLLLHIQDFNNTFEVCINWPSINNLKEAIWEKANAEAFRTIEAQGKK